MVWNEETIRQLRDLWAEGHSTAEIGRRLGVSKNAIVGKAHRLDLEARPSPIRRDGVKSDSDRPSYTRAAGPTLPPLASMRSAEPPVANVAPLRRPVVASPVKAPQPAPAPLMLQPAPRPVLSASTRRPAPSCCWPIGEPGTKSFRFCDDASLPGKPYCEQHARVAYVRVTKDRKEDAA